MKNLKKILLVGVLTLTCFLGINNVSALTKSDLDKIEEEYHKVCDEFEEGELPSFDNMSGYLTWSYAWAEDYIISEEEINSDEIGVIRQYRVPSDVFEKEMIDRYFITDEYLENFRKSFNEVENWSYKQIDNKYYYEYELNFGYGGIGGILYEGVKGYKDLGNDYYQVYIIAADGDENYTPPAGAVEGDDYVIVDSIMGKVLLGYSFKVYYTAQDIKFASNKIIEKNEIPKSSELILYKNLSDKDAVNLGFIETTTKFDAKKEDKLTFKIDAEFDLFDNVYVDGKEVDKKMYEAKSGSTVITFTDEYTKTLKNGEHTFKTTFTDGSSAETKFTVENSTVGETVKNPVTGLFTGLGLMGLVGAASAGAYVTIKRKNKFPNA